MHALKSIIPMIVLYWCMKIVIYYITVVLQVQDIAKNVIRTAGGSNQCDVIPMPPWTLLLPGLTDRSTVIEIPMDIEIDNLNIPDKVRQVIYNIPFIRICISNHSSVH